MAMVSAAMDIAKRQTVVLVIVLQHLDLVKHGYSDAPSRARIAEAGVEEVRFHPKLSEHRVAVSLVLTSHSSALIAHG